MALPVHVAAIAKAIRDAHPNRDGKGRLVPGHRAPRRAPRAQYPHLIEAEYAKALVGVVDRIRGAVKPTLAKLPDLIDRAAKERSDSADRADVGAASELTREIDRARAQLAGAIDTDSLRRLALKHADATDAFAKAQFKKQARAAIGVDVATADKRVPALLDHFAAENVQLIRSLGNKTLDDVAKLATRALANGTTTDDLADDIADRYGIAERHARLIARDQCGKLNGQLAAARQKEIGVTRFVWRSAGDERVRPEHQDLDGRTFSYDDPPSDGLPGEPVCCRCTAEPVMDDVLGDDE